MSAAKYSGTRLGLYNEFTLRLFLDSDARNITIDWRQVGMSKRGWVSSNLLSLSLMVASPNFICGVIHPRLIHNSDNITTKYPASITINASVNQKSYSTQKNVQYGPSTSPRLL
jgi:hypothetical protein